MSFVEAFRILFPFPRCRLAGTYDSNPLPALTVCKEQDSPPCGNANCNFTVLFVRVVWIVKGERPLIHKNRSCFIKRNMMLLKVASCLT